MPPRREFEVDCGNLARRCESPRHRAAGIHGHAATCPSPSSPAPAWRCPRSREPPAAMPRVPRHEIAKGARRAGAPRPAAGIISRFRRRQVAAHPDRQRQQHGKDQHRGKFEKPLGAERERSQTGARPSRTMSTTEAATPSGRSAARPARRSTSRCLCMRRGPFPPARTCTVTISSHRVKTTPCRLTNGGGGARPEGRAESPPASPPRQMPSTPRKLPVRPAFQPCRSVMR